MGIRERSAEQFLVLAVLKQPEQAENFKKILLTLTDDPRVILIKLADRLHNMRTLDSMKREKQLKIASETVWVYAPLAHRMGLYSIKTEM
ncbi:MAG: HD domain-containing protein, partial [Polynucleobacter victoriensis]